MVVGVVALFSECLVGFNLSDHIGKFESDDRVFGQFFSECGSFVGKSHGFLKADSAHGKSLHRKCQSFVVKIVHDVLESEVGLSDKVLYRYVHIFENDK